MLRNNASIDINNSEYEAFFNILYVELVAQLHLKDSSGKSAKIAGLLVTIDIRLF